MADAGRPFDANGARLFEAINGLLEGTKDVDALGILQNICAFAMNNAVGRKGGNANDLAYLLEQFVFGIETLLIENMNKNSAIPTVNEILAKDAGTN
jgi:hypothetical protein